MKTYIILYKDGSMMVFNHKPEKRGFQEGSKLFVTNDTTQIIQLCEWYGRRNLNHSKIKEVEDWK